MSTACNHCPIRNQCTSTCEAIEKLLPKEWHGRIHGLRRRNAAAHAGRFEHNRSVVRLMTDHRHVLRGRCREVFDLTYNEMLTQDEVGRRLGISRRVVGHYLQRAHSAIAARLHAL